MVQLLGEKEFQLRNNRYCQYKWKLTTKYQNTKKFNMSQKIRNVPSHYRFATIWTSYRLKCGTLRRLSLSLNGMCHHYSDIGGWPFFNSRITSFIKLLINVVISVLRYYLSANVTPSVLLVVTHVLHHLHCHWFYPIAPRRSLTITSCNILDMVQWWTLQLNWMLPLRSSQADIACSPAKQLLLDDIADWC